MSNPFDILFGVLKGHEVILRPVSFNDDDDYDKNYIRPNGELIRPTMAVTTCPICGQLIEQIIEPSAKLDQPIPTYCETCHPFVHVSEKLEYDFPFRDPMASNILVLFDINPTALANIDAMFIDEENEKPRLIEEIEDHPMVERRSGGLGQFIRRRNQWKKIKQPEEQTTEFFGGGDVFDTMGELMGNTPDQIPTDFEPDGQK